MVNGSSARRESEAARVESTHTPSSPVDERASADQFDAAVQGDEVERDRYLIAQPTDEELQRWERLDATAGDSAQLEALTPFARDDIARRIYYHKHIDLLKLHPSGRRDGATAWHNIVDTANGRPANRSEYGSAPGGVVHLSVRMLKGMLALAESYSFRVTEIAGGEHSRGSWHYQGTAFDVDIINGQPVNPNSRHWRGFMQRARALGAAEVLGPDNDANHATHVHCAWTS